MATETQVLDSVAASSNLTGATVANLDEGVASPGGDWATATSDGTNVTLRVTFPTPTGNPTTGAGLQSFRFYVRKSATGGTNPTYAIDLYESGSLVTANIGTGTITSETGETITATWDATSLGTANGSAVEALLTVSRSGGSPGDRRSADVDAVEWVVDYAAAAVTGTFSKTLGALTSSSAGDVAVDGTVSKTLGTATLSSAGKRGTITAPSTVSGCTVDLRGDGYDSSTGTWANSGTGGNFTQGTAGLRPGVDSAWTYRNGVDFDGSDDYVAGGSIATLLSADSWYFAAAVEFTSLGAAPNASDWKDDPIATDNGGFWGVFVNTSGVCAYQWDGAAKATTEIAVSTGTPYFIEAWYDGTDLYCRVDDGTPQSVTAGNITTTTGVIRIGDGNLTTTPADITIGDLVMVTSVPSDTDIQSIRDWMAYRYNVTVPSSSSVTGTAAVTLGALTSSAAADVAVDGSASPTLGALTSSSAAAVAVDGTSAASLGALTSSAAGAVAVDGSSSISFGALTGASSGTVSTVGTVAATLGALTSSASGTVAVDGAASVTLGAATSAASGTVAVDGASAASLGALTSSAAGAVAVDGSTSSTLGALALASSGGSTAASDGTASITLGAATSSASGAVAVDGTASPTLGSLAVSAAASAPADGTLSATLGALTASASGASAIAGSLSRTLGAASVAASGAVSIDGSLAGTLGTLSASASAGVSVEGTASTTLGAATLSASGAVLGGVVGSLAVTLGSLGLRSAPVTGAASRTLRTLSAAIAAEAESTALAARTGSGDLAVADSSSGRVVRTRSTSITVT